MIAVDDYVIDVLMRDLVAHDRRPRQFLAVPVACQGTTASRGSSSGELSGNGRIRRRLQKFRTSGCELARATQTGWSHEEEFDGNSLLHGTPSLDCGRKTRAVGFKHTLNPVPSPLLRAKIC